MASPSNSPVLVVARFLLSCPFLVNGFTTALLLSKTETASLALDQVRPLWVSLGALAKDVPLDKLAIFLAVTQGLGGFLLVFNHKFGGMLLMLYLTVLIPLSNQFWATDSSNLLLQLDVLGRFLKNVAIMGGVLAFMATTDEVPLKVKRKPHTEKPHTD